MGSHKHRFVRDDQAKPLGDNKEGDRGGSKAKPNRTRVTLAALSNVVDVHRDGHSRVRVDNLLERPADVSPNKGDAKNASRENPNGKE